MNPVSRCDFRRLFCLANIDPTTFSERDRLFSSVQRRGIIKKYGSTPNITVSARREIEKKRKY